MKHEEYERHSYPPNRRIVTKWEGPPIRKLIVDLLSRSREGKVELRWIWLKILSLFTRFQFDQKYTRRTGFSVAWWQWRLPVRWALEILVLLPGESTCCCRSSWALEIILVLAREPPLIRSPSSSRATILGSLMITLLYLCRLTCFLFFLGAPNLSWVSQWIAWNLPLISTNYCPWFFYDPGQVRMSHVNKEFVWI